MRAVITTVLDLLGLLLLVAAATVLVWPVSASGALAVAGVGLIGGSLVIDVFGGRARLGTRGGRR